MDIDNFEDFDDSGGETNSNFSKIFIFVLIMLVIITIKVNIGRRVTVTDQIG